MNSRRLKGILTWLCCLALAAGFALPASGLADEGATTVLYVDNPNPSDRLHLRTKADADATSLGKYYNGVKVEVLASPSGGWTKVRIEDTDTEGYIQSKFLSASAVASAIPTATVKVAANSEGLNLRQSASSTAKSLGKYKNGTQVEVLGYGSQWHHVRVDGKTGYMSVSYLKLGDAGTKPPEGKTATVSNPDATDRLHLRKQPKTDAVSLGKYYNGVVVTILEDRADGWAKVQIGDTVGYMQKQYLSGDAVTSAMPTVKVSNPNPADRLNLRAEASEKSDSLGKYYNDTEVEVLGLTRTWYHVRVDGKVGYMLAKYLTPQLKYDK